MNKESKVIAIIPARYASSRFPGKMLVDIAGKTLIQRTYENSLKSPALDLVAIATDDRRIYDHAQGLGVQAFMTSKDCQDGTTRIIEVLSQGHFENAEIIVNIQGDEPCLKLEAISSAVGVLQRDNEAVVSTIVSKIKDFDEVNDPSVVKCVFDKNYNALYFSRSPIPASFDKAFHGKNSNINYYRHIGLYCYRRDFLLKYKQYDKTPLQLAESLEQLNILENGHRIKVAIVDQPSLDVNTPEDIQKLCLQSS